MELHVSWWAMFRSESPVTLEKVCGSGALQVCAQQDRVCGPLGGSESRSWGLCQGVEGATLELWVIVAQEPWPASGVPCMEAKLVAKV